MILIHYLIAPLIFIVIPFMLGLRPQYLSFINGAGGVG